MQKIMQRIGTILINLFILNILNIINKNITVIVPKILIPKNRFATIFIKSVLSIPYSPCRNFFIEEMKTSYY